MAHENIMESGGYYVATHLLTVWKCLAGLAPDQPHGWSFPDECWLIIKLSSTRTGDLLKYDELTEPEIITIYHLTETDTQIPSLASYGCGPDQ